MSRFVLILYQQFSFGYENAVNIAASSVYEVQHSFTAKCLNMQSFHKNKSGRLKIAFNNFCYDGRMKKQKKSDSRSATETRFISLSAKDSHSKKSQTESA